jgi:hypothetical protein
LTGVCAEGSRRGAALEPIMAKAKEKPTSKRGRQKGEQGSLPTMEPKKNERIHKLALSYVRVRDHRMELTKEEVDARTLLLDAMKDEGESDYHYEDIHVQITTDLKIKVKKDGKDADE